MIRLRLKGPVGPHAPVGAEDALAMKRALRGLGAYEATDAEISPLADARMLIGMKEFQRENGIHVDGLAEPGGPTEIVMRSALARRALERAGPRGRHPLPELRLRGGVGRDEENRPGDVAAMKNALAWVETYPADRARLGDGRLDEDFRRGLDAFQRDHDLIRDGRARPGGQTEAHLNRLVTPMVQLASMEAVAGDRVSGTDREQPTQVAQAPKPTPVPPIPRYANGTERVEKNDWETFHGALDRTGATELEREVFGQIYSHEGGSKADNTTVAGITQKTLNSLRNQGPWGEALAEAGIVHGMTPAQLSPEQRVQVYRLFFNDAVGPSKVARGRTSGLDVMRDKIGDKTTIAAVADTLFREGGPEGAKLIQEAVNESYRRSGVDTRIDEDRRFGTGTMEAIGGLVATPAGRRLFLNTLMDRRDGFRLRREPEYISGERLRTGTYRIP